MIKRNRFRGWYFKLDANPESLAFVVGCASGGDGGHAFIQWITPDFSREISFPVSKYRETRQPLCVTIGNSVFSEHGIHLDCETDGHRLTGDVKFCDSLPAGYDIMGCFSAFPMQCRHSLVSLRNHCDGELTVDEKKFVFRNATGYIEGDSGVSFPSRYTWMQANRFPDNCAFFASVAKIPFAGLRFTGHICALYLSGKHYRFATYNGSRILIDTPNLLQFRRGTYRLTAEVTPNRSNVLSAPQNGAMSRTITESVASVLKLTLERHGKTIYSGISPHAGYETDQYLQG